MNTGFFLIMLLVALFLTGCTPVIFEAIAENILQDAVIIQQKREKYYEATKDDKKADENSVQQGADGIKDEPSL